MGSEHRIQPQLNLFRFTELKEIHLMALLLEERLHNPSEFTPFLRDSSRALLCSVHCSIAYCSE